MKHMLMPLPKPAFTVDGRDCYDMNQMRAFALDEVNKAVAAERERCEMLCRDIARVHRYAYDGGIKSRHQEESSPHTKGMADGASECASAIRVTPYPKP